MEAFDQSFERFHEDFKNLDPWVESDALSSAWAFDPIPSTSPQRVDDLAWNQSFESGGTSVFNFSNASVVTPTKETRFDTPKRSINVTIKEQLSTVFNQSTDQPVYSVEGSIMMKMSQVGYQDPVYLTLRDVNGQIVSVEGRDNLCNNVTENSIRDKLQRNDRVLQVVPAQQHELCDGNVIVARYTCNQKVKPVPMLVKSRVQPSEHSVRAGFKIRANPSNLHPLDNIVIILAVPPVVNAATVKMSLPGGMWDEIKRTLSWTVDSLAPGDALEIQLQFDFVKGAHSVDCKFPVLIRCDYQSLYSNVQVTNDYNDVKSIPVEMTQHTETRMFHRKV